jgi:hypothetical protein
MARGRRFDHYGYSCRHGDCLDSEYLPASGQEIHSRGKNMGNKKDTKKVGSQSMMGDKPDHEFEGQGSNPGSGVGSPDKKRSGSEGNIDDDEMTTSGGRQGKFSDSESSGGGQWSPGSKQESDR